MTTKRQMTSQNPTNHHDLHVEKLITLQSVQNEPSTHRIPRSFSLSIASNQCCSCPILNQVSSTVEMSAYCPTSNPSNVNLYCKGDLVKEFSFPNDTILGTQLLPLELSAAVVIGQEKTQMTGVILIIASLNKGISIYSIILEKKESSEMFLPVECLEIPSGDAKQFENRHIRTMTATLVDMKDNDTSPFLLVAISSSREGQTSSDQCVAVIRSELPQHKLFSRKPVPNVSPRPSVITVKGKFRGSLLSCYTKSLVILSCTLYSSSDVGRVASMTFGAIAESSAFVSLAVITSTQLTLVQVSLASDSLSLRHSAKLLLSGCHAAHTFGVASMVVPLCGESSAEGHDTESFAIVCRPKSSDVAYTRVAQSLQQAKMDAVDDTLYSISRETAAIANSTFFSPTLTDPRSGANSLIQEVSSARPDTDALIQDTIVATMKGLQQDSHLDDAIRVEEEASKVTPEKIRKIVDITKERAKPAPDASESLLSPLMGLPLTDGVSVRDESALMTSLLHIQAETPTLDRGSSILNTDHASDNMILVRVEYVGQDSQMKLSPLTLTLPQEMTSLEVLSLKPMPACSNKESVNSPSAGRAQRNITFDDLMFSPSPGKLMSPAVSSNAASIEMPQLSIICKSADSQQLYCFVASAKDGNKVCVDSEARFELDKILSDSLDAPIKSLTLKGLVLDDASIKSRDGRIECCNRIRTVLSMNPNTNEESDGPKPINLSLLEDGTIFVATLSCTLPLGGEKESSAALETPDGRIVSHTTDTATEGTLQAILDKLSSFETEVYRRMERMETAIRANTEHLEELEDALLKRSHHDQASF